MLFGPLPEDCAVPLKSDSAQVTQLTSLKFQTVKSTRADFSVGSADLQLQIEASAPGVYRICCVDARHDEKPGARMKVHAAALIARPEAVGEMSICSLTGEDHGWRLEQGDIALEITQSPLQLAVYRGEHCVLRSDPSAMFERQVQGAVCRWSFALELDDDDALYGLGETTADLDRRGARIVSDKPQDRALPLAWSPRGWGLYVNTLGRVEHDLAAKDPGRYSVRLYDNALDIFIFAGEPAEILNQYTALTGRAGQPGLWPMGVWLDQAPGQSVETTLDVARHLRSSGFAFDAVKLSTPALYGFQADKPAFEWDASRVADPRGMLSRFHALNVYVAAASFPGVLADTHMFAEWEDRGWLLLDDDGGAHVFAGNAATAGRPFGLLDLTHKDVYKLWSERQRQLFDEGLGAPVCDAQYDIPDGITARGGESAGLLRTIYPLLARHALFDAVAGYKTPQEGVVISTDLFPAAQRYSWQNGPQVANDWSGLEDTLRASLSLGASGIPLQTHGLGCAVQPLDGMTSELYIRWLAMSVFSANFSFQSIASLLPDAFDATTRELVRHWLQWRYRLIPYVLGIIEDSVRTGLPVQRSMALSFPDDPLAHVWDTQYLLGPAILVAPALQPGKDIKVYLPQGDAWWDLNTGWRYEGGTTWTVHAELDTLPVFGREGHMLCLGPAAQHTGEFNSARILDEVWMFGMPEHSPVVMRNKIRVMQMQGSSYIKGLEGLRILPAEGLEVKRRGAEVRISRAR